jgi:hypothetical protein
MGRRKRSIVMDKSKKPVRPSDLTKGSSPKKSPELTERELDKASGGLKSIDGESTDDKHKGS